MSGEYDFDHDSPFEFVVDGEGRASEGVPPLARCWLLDEFSPGLPEESRRAFSFIADERAALRHRCLSSGFSGEDFDRLWPKCLRVWFTEETVLAAELLAQHMNLATPYTLICSDN